MRKRPGHYPRPFPENMSVGKPTSEFSASIPLVSSILLALGWPHFARFGATKLSLIRSGATTLRRPLAAAAR